VRGIILIELNDVTKIYDGQKVPAVENLDLKVNEGETCVFVGPSGCGKSTEKYKQLPINQDRNLIDNILYSGIWTRHEAEKKKKGDTINNDI
jgi:ABC-type dipeptide/oligopeptide/nickel transport system ATPase subunit